MQHIAEWLEKLGMSEYAQRFTENRIDFEILSDLTDQDLEKLGVVLGDRRKMLRAIAKLEFGTAQPTDAPSAAATFPVAGGSSGPLLLLNLLICIQSLYFSLLHTHGHRAPCPKFSSRASAEILCVPISTRIDAAGFLHKRLEEHRRLL
jgi:hypothetical protein